MSSPALVVVDVQRAFADPVWGGRNNPACEENIGALLERWRKRGWPVVFVRHDSVEAGSPLEAGHAGQRVQGRDRVAGRTCW